MTAAVSAALRRLSSLTPAGRLMALLVLRELFCRGPVPAERVDAVAEMAAGIAGVDYDARAWREALAGLVEVRGGAARLTREGELAYRLAARYLAEEAKKWFRVDASVPC
jgi:hypothetical protein